jgi:hypothetical protein
VPKTSEIKVGGTSACRFDYHTLGRQV